MPSKLETTRSLSARIHELHNQEVINDQLLQWLLVEAKVAVNGMRFVRNLYEDWLDPFLVYPRRIYLQCHAENRHAWEEPETAPSHVTALVALPAGAVQYTIHECARCDAFRISYSDAVGRRVGSMRRVHPEGYMPERHEAHQLPWPSIWAMVLRYVRLLDRLAGYEKMHERQSRVKHPTGRVVLHAV